MNDNKKISNGLNIKILGTGCPNCQRLEGAVKEVLSNLKIEAIVEKITDIQEIMNYGVMSLPGLVINEEVKVSGRIPSAEEMASFLQEGIGEKSENKKEGECGCSCGGCC